MESIVDTLTEREQQTVFECLCAAEQEEFFPEWEFETLFGITRKQLSGVREKWPVVDTHQSDVDAALIGAMNHLLGYPHGQDHRCRFGVRSCNQACCANFLNGSMYSFASIRMLIAVRHV